MPSTDFKTIDHDHENGRVRGVLCIRCNSALGKLGDNTEGLQRAMDYLDVASAQLAYA